MSDRDLSETPVPLEPVPGEVDTESTRYLPYPASTLSPRILPTDLTTFKSRGIGTIQRQFQQQLQELQEQYLELLDQFNWNKLVYEAKFGFEPTIGETYHLYELREGTVLSMIPPQQWRAKKWIGSFRLNADGRWQLVECAEDFDLRQFANHSHESPS